MWRYSRGVKVRRRTRIGPSLCQRGPVAPGRTTRLRDLNARLSRGSRVLTAARPVSRAGRTNPSVSDHAAQARALQIGSFEIADPGDCFVIAEIGHNHQGSLERAHELFDEAKAAGAHAVKLQKRDNRSLYTRELFNKPYENDDSYGATYGEHREALEFDRAQYEELRTYAAAIGVTFFATAFDLASADF